MKTPYILIILLLAFSALTSGCANTNSRPKSASSYDFSASSYDSGVAYGVIDTVEVTHGNSNRNRTGAGTVIGGEAGHQTEKNNQQQDAYRIKVQLEKGGSQSVAQQSMNDLRVGDRVRIENGHVTRDSASQLTRDSASPLNRDSAANSPVAHGRD